MLYSFFASCKANNINPYTWLKDVLNRLAEYKITKLTNCFPITGKI
ncbi:MAG: transposase domain-containing protein [Polaribacter sp.]